MVKPAAVKASSGKSSQVKKPIISYDILKLIICKTNKICAIIGIFTIPQRNTLNN